MFDSPRINADERGFPKRLLPSALCPRVITHLGELNSPSLRRSYFVVDEQHQQADTSMQHARNSGPASAGAGADSTSPAARASAPKSAGGLRRVQPSRGQTPVQPGPPQAACDEVSRNEVSVEPPVVDEDAGITLTSDLRPPPDPEPGPAPTPESIDAEFAGAEFLPPEAVIDAEMVDESAQQRSGDGEPPPLTPEHLHDFGKMLNAASCPKRHQLLRSLGVSGPSNVGPLAERTGLKLDTVSHHLGILYKMDLVRCDPIGRCKCYRLNPEWVRYEEKDGYASLILFRGSGAEVVLRVAYSHGN
jgi:DNA-binding transcriptional ArsR family regulator